MKIKDKEKNSYIRVGTTYFKNVNKPLSSGDTISLLIPWKIETIRSDHGKDYLAKIRKYLGFCCIPSHSDYKQVIPPIENQNEKIHGFYNEYHELEIKPEQGDCKFSLEFMKHIFGEQSELGLDYLKLLYEKPLQILPVLCLVSTIRGTGKTTFLNWLKKCFGKNMTLNTNDDFRSQFNSDWANKLIIAVDEVLLDRKEDSERIKNLSTARSFKAEAKGRDRTEIEFFGKFILCSNNEFHFISLDYEEIRFWVRKINPFEGLLKNNLNNISKILESEIPAFLYYIKNREMRTKKGSRMWFTSEQINTEALQRLKFSNRTKMEKEIINYIKLIMDIEKVDSVCYSAYDIKGLLQNNFTKSDLSEISKILKSKWGLKPSDNSNGYSRYILCTDGTTRFEKAKGRYYKFTKNFIKENFDDFDDI